jgi:hypothetical protein
MALLDGDRFEGKFRDGVHAGDASDLMRRLVKEQLLKFDGRPLFPERIAYTVNYNLSDAEADLYRRVTDYVREEFNRAEALEGEGRKGTVGFALTILQRRLVSSPGASTSRCGGERSGCKSGCARSNTSSAGLKPHQPDAPARDAALPRWRVGLTGRRLPPSAKRNEAPVRRHIPAPLSSASRRFPAARRPRMAPAFSTSTPAASAGGRPPA